MNELADPAAEVRISPEALEVATTYLECSDRKITADIIGIDIEKVDNILSKPEVRRFVDNVFLDQGYLNRHKLQETLTTLIEKKLEELEEAEIGSSKDILDLLQAAHKMRMEEMKAMTALENAKTSKTQTVNINGTAQFGNNYSSLLDKLNKPI